MQKVKSRIFLVEDEVDIMYLNKTVLTEAGFDVVGVNTGKEAVEKIKEVQEQKEPKPDLILLDLVLPDINGLEILRMIRENTVTSDVKVFILSNYTSDALQNIQYIKPDKFIVKSETSPTKLAELIREELKAE